MSRRTWVIAGLAVFYAVGLAGHLMPAFLPWMLVLTPWFLVASGAVVTIEASRGSDLGALLRWFAPVAVVTFALEAVGVATGLVFGAYHYTSTLGSLVAGVPPVIALNWVLVVWGVHSAVGRVAGRLPEAARVLLVALACVAFDALLEPVAIGLGYWVWQGGAVPLQNYLAWGVIAGAASWWAGRFRTLSSDALVTAAVLVQSVFFAVLGAAGVRV